MKSWSVILAIMVFITPGAQGRDNDAFHAIVCDAGSTGTRLYVYKIHSNGKLESVTGKKSKPGLSNVLPEDAAEYLFPLIEDASKKIPETAHESTPIFVIATAGMRLLPEKSQQAIYDRAAKELVILLQKKKLSFKVDRRNFKTASGLEEGYWGFLAANFLQERMGKELRIRGGKQLAGVLDLGGSSTQISFKCSGSISNGKNHIGVNDLFVHSFLGYGGVLLAKRSNPCDFLDYERRLAPSNKTTVGSGNGAQCRSLIRENLINKRTCDEPPCFFANVHNPAVQSRNDDAAAAAGAGGGGGGVCGQFVAISLYYYAIDCLRSVSENILQHAHRGDVDGLLHRWPTPTLKDITKAADVFCQSEWEKVATWKHAETPSKEAWSGRCFEVNYIISILHNGYGINDTARSVTFLRDIKAIAASTLTKRLTSPPSNQSNHKAPKWNGRWALSSSTFGESPNDPTTAFLQTDSQCTQTDTVQKRLELSEAKKSGKDDAGDGPKVEGGGDLTYPATSLTPADPFISAASLDFIPSVLLIAVLLTVPLLLIYLKGQNKSLTELVDLSAHTKQRDLGLGQEQRIAFD
eukprot:jgi/Bigna1/143774/aug1.81_g18482